jgi:hypothetical protein
MSREPIQTGFHIAKHYPCATLATAGSRTVLRMQPTVSAAIGQSSSSEDSHPGAGIGTFLPCVPRSCQWRGQELLSCENRRLAVGKAGQELLSCENRRLALSKAAQELLSCENRRLALSKAGQVMADMRPAHRMLLMSAGGRGVVRVHLWRDVLSVHHTAGWISER